MQIFKRALIFCLLLTGAQLAGLAQTSRRPTAARPGPALASMLPSSDTVALVKVKRLLDDALPAMLASNPARLTEVNARLENFKTRTGLDPRAFEELALGLGYAYLPSGAMKVTTVALAQGTFSSTALVAAGRKSASGTYREEKYQGKTIHVFRLDEQLRVFGLLDLRVRELAVAPLNANTLALGDVQRVRGAIDAAKGTKRVNAELISLASQNPDAIVGFGGNISPALIAHLRIGNDAVAKDLASVRQIYGFVSMTEKDVEVLAAARTADPNSARSLGATVEGLTAFAGLFTNRLPAARAALARAALGNLKVTVQGNDLQLRTAVAQADVGPVIRGF
ncbi:MAG TPA: hypothetical protein VJS64_13545 [Pyrinomonadaceae bacterium]|nr:hypothetical protein [Pyrinomonadaceae bacterium]